MPQQFSKYRITLWLSIICAITLPYSISAQNQSQSTTADTVETKKVIEPVALSNIGSETDQTLSKIREFRNIIQQTENEARIDSIVPLKLEQINKLKNDLDLDQIKEMRLIETESLKNDFVQFNVQLEEWRKNYAQKTEEINALRDELKELDTKWKKTLEMEREEPLPEQVMTRINTNLKEITTLNGAISDRNNSLLTKQTELTDALSFIDEVLSEISNFELSYSDQILTIDSPPFWMMFSHREDSTTLKVRFNDVLRQHKEDLKDFSVNYEQNIYWHLILFVVLLLVLYYLKGDVARWSNEKKDEAIGYSLHVINRPVTSALLVVLLTSGLFYPEAPRDVLNYYYIILVIPIIRLLPGLIPSLNRKYFYYIAAVFFISQITEYMSELIIIDRLFLFVIDLITALILFNLIRNHKKIAEKNPRINWRFTFTVLRLSLFLLTISIIANFVGNAFLSKILSRGTLTMLFGGTIIYSSALVLRSLFSLLIQQKTISKLNMIQNYPDEVKKQIFRTIRIVSVVYWLYLTLDRFLIYEPLYGWIEDFLTNEWKIGSMDFSIGSILAFFITLWIALTLSKFIRFILQDEILTHFEMPRGVPGAISMIVRLVLITIGFILAFAAAEIELDNIAIIFGALGVGIGFGLQNIFNNLVSGLILAFERPIQVGDIIQIATLNLMGEVKDIGIRASIVKTFDGAEVVVPNGNLISNEMINWTLSDKRRRQEIIVGVAYGTDINKVLEILNNLVPEHENVLKNPAPLIIFLGFGESSLDFRVLFWTHFEVGLSTKSAVGVAIDEAFKKEGIEIPFPQRDLHLRSISENVSFQNPPSRTKKPSTSKTKTGPQKK
jgi:potassium efflux system protein